MLRQPPRSTLFPTRRSSDLSACPGCGILLSPSTAPGRAPTRPPRSPWRDRKRTRLNSSHGYISYAVFCLKQKSLHEIGQRLLALLQLGPDRPFLVGGGRFLE